MFPFLSCEVNTTPTFSFEPVSIGSIFLGQPLPNNPPINLTTLGGLDYQKVSGGSFATGIRKSGGGSVLSVAEFDPNNVLTIDFENKELVFVGSDGTPTSNFSDNQVARAVDFSTHTNPIGITLTAPAGNGLRTCFVWVMAYSQLGGVDQASLNVTISDSSFSPYNQTFQFSAGTDNYYLLKFTYRGTNPTSTIAITFASITPTATVRAMQYIASWVSKPS